MGLKAKAQAMTFDVEDTIDGDWDALREGVLEWWEREDYDFPWREEDEEWKLLVTEILLQRTRASAVAETYDAFFNRFPTAERLAEASEDEVGEAIYSLGLAWRAEYIRKLGQALAEMDSQVPKSREELKDLPGVGPYVSGAFQVLHRNQESDFVDANVVRLLGRFYGFEWDGETRRRKWFLKLVKRLFEHEYQPEKFGYALLDFTREVCSRSPSCERCALKSRCTYGQRQQS